MYTFTFKGISSEQFNVFIPVKPIFPLAQQNVDYIEIPGRNGHLTNDYNCRKSLLITAECCINDISDSNMRDVRAWLCGSGDLIFSTEPEKKWKARLDLPVDINTPMVELREFILVFDCYPLAYAIDNIPLTLTTSPTKIINMTNTNAEPVIKIYGSGSINLSINGSIIYLTNVSEYVIIDSDMVDCYKDTMPKNNDMEGEFPILNVGDNIISWTGSVTEVLLTPNYRWI